MEIDPSIDLIILGILTILTFIAFDRDRHE